MRFLSLKNIVTANMPILSDRGKALFLEKVGMDLREKIKDNALKKFPSSLFWQDISKSSAYEVGADSVTAGNNHHAALHKQIGGWISAPGKGARSKKRQWLTIPVGKAKDGKKTWQDFPQNTTVFRKSGNKLALIFEVKSWKTATRGKRAGEQVPDELGDLLFVCKRAVFQKGEFWFPTEAEVKDIVAKVTKKIMRVGGL